jgi:hypothetical protein
MSKQHVRCRPKKGVEALRPATVVRDGIAFLVRLWPCGLSGRDEGVTRRQWAILKGARLVGSSDTKQQALARIEAGQFDRDLIL